METGIPDFGSHTRGYQIVRAVQVQSKWHSPAPNERLLKARWGLSWIEPKSGTPLKPSTKIQSLRGYGNPADKADRVPDRPAGSGSPLPTNHSETVTAKRLRQMTRGSAHSPRNRGLFWRRHLPIPAARGPRGYASGLASDHYDCRTRA